MAQTFESCFRIEDLEVEVADNLDVEEVSV